MESKFKVGEFVKVVNTGGFFTTYRRFFDFNRIPRFGSQYVENESAEGTFKVVAIGKHEDDNKHEHYGPIYVLESQTGQIYLCHEKSKYSSEVFIVPINRPSSNTVENLKVIRNGKATIVFLPTGEKGVAKCNPYDEYDASYGLMLAYQRAIAKRQKRGGC